MLNAQCLMKNAAGPVLVCFAVREEAKFFSPPEGLQTKVQVRVTGIGRKNAEAAALQAIEQIRPQLVLTCGFAGGLHPDLALNAIVFSTDEGSWLRGVLEELGAIPVRFHCSTRIATTVHEKQELRRQTGADAVEMESETIRQLCRRQGIESATIRVISDSANEDLPLDFHKVANENLEISYGRLAWELARSPGRIPALIRFQRQTERAARQLGRTLESLLIRRSALSG
jgi:nucleoside phosphorylase